MTPERWKEITDVFHDVSQIPEAQRDAWLRERCAHDPGLVEEVSALLRHDRAEPGFLASPVLAGNGGHGTGQALACGRQLAGRFVIVELLGVGGMSEVYRAHDAVLNRSVAIKVLRQVSLASQESQQRLEAEARAVATLAHPHICAVHDLLRDGDVLFLIMEYVEGVTLARRLRSGPLDLEGGLSCLTQVAGALDAAHSRNVIHRDLKPANIMLTGGGAKLLDFGIAKFLGAAEPAGPRTQEGFVVGTEAYMSPEQRNGEELDVRSDVFSFGLLMYEALTGERLITKAGGHAASDRSGEYAVSDRFAKLPAPVQGVIRMSIAHDRDHRFATMSAVLNALRSVPRSAEGPTRASVMTPTTAATMAAGHGSKRPLRLSFLVGLLVATAVGAQLYRSQTETPGSGSSQPVRPPSGPVSPEPQPLSPAPAPVQVKVTKPEAPAELQQLAKAGRFVEVLAVTDRILLAEPGNLTVMVVRGTALIQLQRSHEALRLFETVLSLSPEEPDGFLGRGLAYKLLGQQQPALNDLNRAIELNPKEPLAFFARADSFLLLNEFQRAFDDSNHAISLEPNFADAYPARGVARERLGDVRGAVADLDTAIRLRPGVPDWYVIRGNQRRLLGDLQGAADDGELARRLGWRGFGVR